MPVPTTIPTLTDLHAHGAAQQPNYPDARAVEEVVAELSLEADEVVAVSFMVAEGVLRDRMAERTARLGVEMVSGALSSTGALADLVVARAAQRLGLMMSA